MIKERVLKKPRAEEKEPPIDRRCPTNAATHSVVCVNLKADQNSWHRDWPRHQLDELLSGCSVNPQTPQEWSRGHQRFQRPADEFEMKFWNPGFKEPTASGLLINLTTQSCVLSHDLLPWVRGVVAVKSLVGDFVDVPYTLPPDWQLETLKNAWLDLETTADIKTPDPCPRNFLYSGPSEFFVDQLAAIFSSSPTRQGEWKPPRNWQWFSIDPPEPNANHGVSLAKLFEELCGRWILGPHSNSEASRPGAWLESHRLWIEHDLHDRQLQWVRTGVCPPPLSTQDSAYRYSGMGPHESWIYQELLHDLVRFAAAEVLYRPKSTRDERVREVHDRRETWMATSPSSIPSSHLAKEIVEYERRRIPWSLTTEEIADHCTCGFCRSLALQVEPVFFHLDSESSTTRRLFSASSNFSRAICPAFPERGRQNKKSLFGDSDLDLRSLQAECLSRGRLLLQSMESMKTCQHHSSLIVLSDWTRYRPTQILTFQECSVICDQLSRLIREELPVHCMVDWVHESFQNLKDYLHAHPSVARNGCRPQH